MIDETWLTRVRAMFLTQLGPAVGAVFASTGEDQEAAVRQVHENLALIEAELRDGAFKGRRFFGGDEVGLLDVVLGCGSYWLAVFEEVTGVRLVDADAFPLFHAWLRDFEVCENIPRLTACSSTPTACATCCSASPALVLASRPPPRPRHPPPRRAPPLAGRGWRGAALGSAARGGVEGARRGARQGS